LGEDTESGICTVSKIIDDASASAFIKPGDKAGFVIVSDESDQSKTSTCIKGSKVLYVPGSCQNPTYSCPDGYVKKQGPLHNSFSNSVNQCAHCTGGSCPPICDGDGSCHPDPNCNGGGSCSYYNATCTGTMTCPATTNTNGVPNGHSSNCTCNAGDGDPGYGPFSQSHYGLVGACAVEGYTCVGNYSQSSCTTYDGTYQSKCCPEENPRCNDPIDADEDPCSTAIPRMTAFQFTHSQAQSSVGYNGSNGPDLLLKFPGTNWSNEYSYNLTKLDQNIDPVSGAAIRSLPSEFIFRADQKLGPDKYFVSTLIHDQQLDASLGCSLTGTQSYGTSTYGAFARAAGLARSMTGNFVGSICSSSYSPFLQSAMSFINTIIRASWLVEPDPAKIATLKSRVTLLTYTRARVTTPICSTQSECASSTQFDIDSQGYLNVHSSTGVQDGDVVQITFLN
jgi:hypothetical protein